jgi:hypothetical protein
MTAAYLNPSELVDVWSNIKSTPCYRNASAEHRVWTDLLAAVAGRNPTEIVALGSPLLETPSSLSRHDLTYLTTVMAAAYVRMNKMPQAYNLLLARWSQLELGNTDEFSLSLRELRALAQVRDSAALAQSRAGRRSDQTM